MPLMYFSGEVRIISTRFVFVSPPKHTVFNSHATKELAIKTSNNQTKQNKSTQMKNELEKANFFDMMERLNVMNESLSAATKNLVMAKKEKPET